MYPRMRSVCLCLSILAIFSHLEANATQNGKKQEAPDFVITKKMLDDKLGILFLVQHVSSNPETNNRIKRDSKRGTRQWLDEKVVFQTDKGERVDLGHRWELSKEKLTNNYNIEIFNRPATAKDIQARMDQIGSLKARNGDFATIENKNDNTIILLDSIDHNTHLTLKNKQHMFTTVKLKKGEPEGPVMVNDNVIVNNPSTIGQEDAVGHLEASRHDTVCPGKPRPVLKTKKGSKNSENPGKLKKELKRQKQKCKELEKKHFPSSGKYRRFKRRHSLRFFRSSISKGIK